MATFRAKAPLPEGAAPARSGGPHGSSARKEPSPSAPCFEPRLPSAAPPALPCKAVISAPSDPAEREADEAAHRVMRSAEARVGASPSEGPHSVAADAAVQATRRGGQPLPEAVRRYFEPRFGQDLGQVRVHTDAEADQASRAIGARAYTVRDHVVFSRGRFAPESEEGRHLLAHELTHVVQQRAGGARTAATVQRQAEGPEAPGATPLYAIAGPQSLQVPQGSGGAAGSMNTDTFVIARTPVTVRISATAAYIGPSTNTSDWSVQLFRSTLWGADEAIGSLHRGRVGDPLDVSVYVPGGWTASYYLRFRNASQYEPITVSYRVTG